MSTQREIKPFRRDGAGSPIGSGSSISAILNFSVDTTWRTIKAPSEVFCKAFFAKLRSGNSWMVRRAGDSTYMTITASLSMDMAVWGGENLFQVSLSAGSDTLEVMFLD